MARPPIAFSPLSAQPVYQRPGFAILSKSTPNGRFINARQRPFSQGSSKRMARPPDFSDKLHFRYYPAWRAILTSATNYNFNIIPRNQFISGRASFSQQKQAQWQFYQRGPNGRFIGNIGIIPHNQFISGRAKLFSAKAGPMAVLSRQQQPDGQTSRFPVSVLSAQSVYQRPGQAIFSKRRPNDRFIKAAARPADFSDKLHFRYFHAQSVYQSYSQQKHAQWPFYQREAQWPF